MATKTVNAQTVPPVRAAEIIRAGSGRIWDAISTRDGWESWFCQRALVDFRPGGFVHFRWVEWGADKYTGDNRADLVTVETRKRLAFRWKSHDTHPTTLVDIHLEPRGPITVVRLEETGWGDNVQAAMNNSVGWGGALVMLKDYVEHGVRIDGRKAQPIRSRARAHVRRQARHQ